jgi:hypothetical protein
METNMNDAQFDALLAVLKDIAEEMMFIREEISGFRDIYGQSHGFESDSEYCERIVGSLVEVGEKIRDSEK